MGEKHMSLALEETFALPAHPSLGGDDVVVSLVSSTRYAIAKSGETVGFVDVEGPVFVALSGLVYPWAEEISQHRSLLVAIRAVVLAAS
jgi:hypothetical protein